MQLETEGIVLRTTQYSDSDLIINVFTKKFGKIGVYAKNARRLKSPLMSSSQIFAHSNMIINTFDGRYKLAKAELINNNFKISSSYQKLYLGYYYLQFVEKNLLEESTNIRLFELLKDSLANLQENNNFLLQKIVFDLKAVDIFGYKPNVNECVVCSSRSNLGNNFLISDGGRICNSCMDKNFNTRLLDSTTYRLISFILQNNFSNISKANISDVILKELNRVLDNYIDYHFDNIDMTTRKMLIFEEEKQ